MTELVKVNAKQLVQKLAEKALVPKTSTKGQRIAEWKDTTPVKVKALKTALTTLTKRFGSVAPTEKRELTQQELLDLGYELLPTKTLNEATTGINARARAAFFNHLDTIGVVNGTVDLPELGMRFRRSAKGYKDPVVHWDKIGEVWPADKTAEVTITTYSIDGLTAEQIAQIHMTSILHHNNAQVTEIKSVDQEKVAEIAVLNPKLEDALSKIIDPLKENEGSFYFEPLKDDK